MQGNEEGLTSDSMILEGMWDCRANTNIGSRDMRAAAWAKGVQVLGSHRNTWSPSLVLAVWCKVWREFVLWGCRKA